jgi:hypothetical protein
VNGLALSRIDPRIAVAITIAIMRTFEFKVIPISRKRTMFKNVGTPIEGIYMVIPENRHKEWAISSFPSIHMSC